MTKEEGTMKTAILAAIILAALFLAFSALCCMSINWARNPWSRKKRRNRK